MKRNKLKSGHAASTAEGEAWAVESFAEEIVTFETAESDSARTAEAIHERAKMVTPLLEEILACRPPLHWGLND